MKTQSPSSVHPTLPHSTPPHLSASSQFGPEAGPLSVMDPGHAPHDSPSHRPSPSALPAPSRTLLLSQAVHNSCSYVAIKKILISSFCSNKKKKNTQKGSPTLHMLRKKSLRNRPNFLAVCRGPFCSSFLLAFFSRRQGSFCTSGSSTGNRGHPSAQASLIVTQIIGQEDHSAARTRSNGDGGEVSSFCCSLRVQIFAC